MMKLLIELTIPNMPTHWFDSEYTVDELVDSFKSTMMNNPIITNCVINVVKEN